MRLPPSLSSNGNAYRLAVASRALAAIGGGYLLASMCAMCIAHLPMPRVEAVTAGMLCSFAIFAFAVIWVFAARTALRAWAGVGIPAIALAVVNGVLHVAQIAQ